MLRGLLANNADGLTTATRTELNRTCSKCKQRVVLTAANVGACVVAGATLTNQDLACLDGLAAKRLMPRYCGLESRPLRVEPTPFFDAISAYLRA